MENLSKNTNNDNDDEGVYENDIHDLKVEFSEYEIELNKNPLSKSKVYDELMNYSIEKKENFYSDLAKNVKWDVEPKTILDSSNAPFYRWYPDGKINMCNNAIDVHINNCKGDSIALISHSCYTDRSFTVTYNELLKSVCKVANIFVKCGVKTGDTVIIYMPMITEAIYGMLACARIGAIHSVVFGGFSSEELSDRIVDANPKVIYTASCGIEPRKKIMYWPIVKEAIDLARNKSNEKIYNSHIVFYQRTDAVIEESVKEHYIKLDKNSNDEGKKYKIVDYNYEYELANDFIHYISVESNHPLYILYTSGTTGTPKGVVRGTAGQIVMLQYQMEIVMDLNADDVYFSSSDIGWVVGHCFIVYGPLIRGASTIIFEGKPIGTPDAGIFWSLIEKFKVKGLYTAPTAVRAIIKEDPEGNEIKKYSIKSLTNVTLAGERVDPVTVNWLQKNLPNCLINDNYWQTETGYGICCNNIKIHKFPTFPGSTTKPLPGNDLIIYDYDTKREIHEKNVLGKVYAKLPMTPAFMLTLWNNDDYFKSKYISCDNKYYITGDAGYFDSNGYFHILTRLDDVINVAGHRLSTGRMEEVLIKVNGVVEAAVVSAEDQLKGEVPFAFVVIQSNFIDEEIIKSIKKNCLDNIVSHIGAISRLKDCVIVKRLPKTRSGKILRSTLKSILNNKKFKIPSTIEDETVLDEIKISLGIKI